MKRCRILKKLGDLNESLVGGVPYIYKNERRYYRSREYDSLVAVNTTAQETLRWSVGDRPGPRPFVVLLGKATLASEEDVGNRAHHVG